MIVFSWIVFINLDTPSQQKQQPVHLALAPNIFSFLSVSTRVSVPEQYWTSPPKRTQKGPKVLSEINDKRRRSKKSNRCLPPRRETSVQPPAWTLYGRQAIWGAVTSQFPYQNEIFLGKNICHNRNIVYLITLTFMFFISVLSKPLYCEVVGNVNVTYHVIKVTPLF